MQSDSLTIFYDGYCPLCLLEMNKLKALDKNNRLVFVDIQQPTFAEQYPELDWQMLNARIHGYLGKGNLISG